MTKEQISDFLKSQYPRDVRKQLVRSIIQSEKLGDTDTIKQQTMILNQIFSYVLKECSWDIPQESTSLNQLPLEIMDEAFPKLKDTKWFNDQLLSTRQNIKTMVD
jgi:hypothetical protein